MVVLTDDITSRVSRAQRSELENDNMEINRKLDLQVASLKTLLESLKLQTIRYLAGETAAVLLCVCDGVKTNTLV